MKDFKGIIYNIRSFGQPMAYNFNKQQSQAQGYRAMGFGPAMVDEKRKSVHVYSSTTCRDSLCWNFQSGIIGDDEIDWKEGFLKTDKMHLGVVFYMAYTGGKATAKEVQFNKEYFERSIKVLHMFEDFAGWPRTTAHMLRPGNPGAEGKLLVCYYRGSRRWVKAPPMVSLYTLIIRMNLDPVWATAKNFDEIEKIATDEKRNFDTDGQFITNTGRHWRKVLKKYPDLFRKKKITHYWSVLEGNDGVNTLVDLETEDEKTNKIFGKFI